MMISTKGRYALRVMVDLAKHNTGEYVPLNDIAERQDISEKYLESIVSSLSKANVVDSARGKGGGYRLNRELKDYPVSEILRATEGSIAPVACRDQVVNDCARAPECPTLAMWENLQKLIDDYFANVTLEDLVLGKLNADKL